MFGYFTLHLWALLYRMTFPSSIGKADVWCLLNIYSFPGDVSLSRGFCTETNSLNSSCHERTFITVQTQLQSLGTVLALFIHATPNTHC